MKIHKLLLLLLTSLVLAACGPDVVDTWESAKSNYKTTGTTAEIDFGNPNLSTEGFEIMTLAGTARLNGETSAKIEILSGNEAPQIALILNANGRPVMMNRSTGASTTEFNAHTTALAYVTLHPVFALVTDRDEFKSMVQEIERAEGFAELEELVASYIKKGQEPLSENHRDVQAALENVIEGLCSGDSKASRAESSKGIELSETAPIFINIVKQKLNIQTVLLTPMYTGEVINNGGDVVKEFQLKSRSDYSLKGFWWYSTRELLFNDAASIDFSQYPDGEYRVVLDRRNAECVCDLAINLMCNYLDIMGTQLGKVNTTKLRDAIRVYVLARISNFTTMICDGKVECDELYEFIGAAVVDFCSSEHAKPLFEAGGCAIISTIASKLNKVYNFYCFMRGTSNGLLRASFGLTSPAVTSFCVCKEQGKELTSCTDRVTLELVGGDNQEAYPGKQLLLPVEVKVVPNGSANAASHYNVHFEVFSGGSITPEVCTVEAGGIATAYWTLAESPEIQQVSAYVTDIATGKVMSNTVWVNAKIAKHTLALYSGDKHFPWEGGSHMVRVGTNCAEVELSVSPSSASWLTAEYRPTGSPYEYEAGYVRYSVTENRDTKERRATIHLVGKDEDGKVVAKNKIVVTQNPYEEPAQPEPEKPAEYDFDEFYSAWRCENFAADYRGNKQWRILKFFRDKTWKIEVWEYKDFGNSTAELQTGEWYGTFTVKHNDFESTMIKKNPQLLGVYDITMKCTGTDLPDWVDEHTDRSAGSFVGQSGTYMLNLGVSEALGDEPFVTLFNTSDPVGLNETYKWDPAKYTRSSAAGSKAMRSRQQQRR